MRWRAAWLLYEKSIPRHLRYVGALGVTDRFAGELAVGIPVVELSNEDKTFRRMVEVGKALRERHGSDVVVMGCAGMARYRKPLQDEIGIPVVEPTQASSPWGSVECASTGIRGRSPNSAASRSELGLRPRIPGRNWDRLPP